MKFDLICGSHSAAKVTASVIRVLRTNILLSMATVDRRRSAHVNTAYFCYTDALDIYFVSAANSRHAQNVLKMPRVGSVVFDSRQRWNADHSGLQLFGRCREATPAEALGALRAYTARFPASRPYLSSVRTEQNRATFRFYLFRPTRLKLLDEGIFGEETFIAAKILRQKLR